MVEDKWKLEWYWDESLSLLTIHVFPHRTFIIRVGPESVPLHPYLAGICCFNVILGQDRPMNVQAQSKEPLPNGLLGMCSYLEKVSERKFSMRFPNLEDGNPLPKNGKKVLLFSGGKDSLWQLRYLQKTYPNEDIQLLYVKGNPIAGEYVKELEMVGKTVGKDRVTITSFEC